MNKALKTQASKTERAAVDFRLAGVHFPVTAIGRGSIEDIVDRVAQQFSGSIRGDMSVNSVSPIRHLVRPNLGVDYVVQGKEA